MHLYYIIILSSVSISPGYSIICINFPQELIASHLLMLFSQKMGSFSGRLPALLSSLPQYSTSLICLSRPGIATGIVSMINDKF